jgi:hypothetical protein
MPGVFDEIQTAAGYEHLKTVHGDCGTRPETIGAQRIFRKRADNSISKQYRADEKLVKEYRKGGCRADYLGYFETPHCRQTAWTRENPEVLKGVHSLIVAADNVFKESLPDRYQFQYYHACESPDFQLWNTAFSTMTVNRKLSTTYHQDKGDLKGGFGVMLTLGNFKGGALVFPAFKVAIDYQPGSLILADVHETHGNLPLKDGDDRVTCILYVRERIKKCGLAEDVEDRMKGKMSVHARED